MEGIISVLKRQVKKIFCMALSLLMFISLSTPVWGATSDQTADELTGHWAEKQMRLWIEKGLLSGDNGRYYPNRAVTRAELMTLINKAFNFNEKAAINFKDIQGHWAQDQVAIAVRAGYIQGYQDQTVRPDQKVTREEAAVMIAGVLQLKPGAESALSAFKDHGSIADWSRAFVAALAESKLISGTPEGLFAPQNQMTRAEAVTILNNALQADVSGVVYDKPGVYGPETGTETIEGNVMVAAPGVTLRNMDIKGNLTVAESVGEGDVTLKKVKVSGTATIAGGGENSIHIEDSVLIRVVVNKSAGVVRLVAIGDTSIETAVIHTPVKLEESEITDTGFKNVELASNLPAGSQVQLTGQFENVSIFAAEIKVTIPSGSVDKLQVEPGAGNAQIEVGAAATVAELVMNALIELLGQGVVERAVVNTGAEGSRFENVPVQTEGEAASSISVPGSTSGGSGSGASEGSDGGSGGTDGGGTGPSQPQCTGTAEECRDATLVNIEVPGFDLEQLDNSYYNTGVYGFDKNVLAYRIVTPANLQGPETLSMTVTKSVYSTASFILFDKMGKPLAYGSLNDTSTTKAFTFQPDEDYLMSILVKSGDGIAVKQYDVHLNYRRTIQEAAKFSNFIYYDTDGEGNGIAFNNYILNIGLVEGEKVRTDDLIQVFRPGDATPLKECGIQGCEFSPAELDDEETWYIKVLRDGTVYAEGYYTPNFHDVPLIYSSADIGLSVRTLTKQELIQRFVEDQGLTFLPTYAYEIYLDAGKLLEEVPNAKYMSIHQVGMRGKVTELPPALTKEELKTNIYPVRFGGGVNGTFVFGNYIDAILAGPHVVWTHSSSQGHSIVDDEFVLVGIYDDHFDPIAQTVLVVSFDEDHVADGFTPAGNWQPQ
jgi:hypothetical protein